MKRLSNFDLQSQKQYYSEEVKEESRFTSSGADEYFREYDSTEKYFSNDQEVLYGKSFPLKTQNGVPEEDETAEFYTFYTYAKQ